MAERSFEAVVETGWRLEGDAIDTCGLRIALQRICRDHWRPGAVLRSWGVAPLHRQGDSLCVPCGDDEALWLGAWPEPREGVGEVWLRDPADGRVTRIDLPMTGAIITIGAVDPIERPANLERRELRLGACGRNDCAVEIVLVLVSPSAWSVLAGRPWRPLTGPPPLPPRLGRRLDRP